MPSNRDIILNFYKSLENSDFETLNQLWHNDVTLSLIGTTPVSGDFRGKETAINLIENGVLAKLKFDTVSFANKWDIVAVDDNIVVGTMTLKGQSIYNKDYNQIYCQIFTIKDYKIYRLHEFFDTALVESSLYNKDLV